MQILIWWKNMSVSLGKQSTHALRPSGEQPTLALLQNCPIAIVQSTYNHTQQHPVSQYL